MATHPGLNDSGCLPGDLEWTLKDLQTQVDTLQQCLHDSLDLNKNNLDRWDFDNGTWVKLIPADSANLIQVTASTPHVTDPSYKPKMFYMSLPGNFPAQSASHFQSNAIDLQNTTRVWTAALHQAKLKPHVFTGDGMISRENWLQSINGYRSSLELTDAQILRKLASFLAGEPKKWFSVLSMHVVSWTDFCDLFRTFFLPADNQ